MKTITLDQTYTVSDKTAQKIQELIDRDKKVTYEQIMEGSNFWEFNIGAKSQKQIAKIQAINKLLNVAKYLNGDWHPDWNDAKNMKFCFYIYDNKLTINYNMLTNTTFVHFKTEQLAQEAIDILGEETIRTALSTDY